MPTRLPPLRLLTAFESVARLGVMSRAAAELNVSQPAISQAIRQLEEHLGAKLFDRATRPAQLTEAGLLLDAALRDGFGRITAAIDAIIALQRADQSVLTVACSVGVATHWLMPRLSRFFGAHQDVVVNVHTTAAGAPELTPEVDMAIRFGHGKWRDGETIKLFNERVRPVCHPDLKARLADARTPLNEAPLLHVDAHEPSWLGWDAYLDYVGQPRNRARGRSFTNYVQTTQAALDGLGVMLGWRSITGDLEAEGRLTPLEERVLAPKNAFYLSWRPNDAKDLALRRLADWLRNDAA